MKLLTIIILVFEILLISPLSYAQQGVQVLPSLSVPSSMETPSISQLMATRREAMQNLKSAKIEVEKQQSYAAARREACMINTHNNKKKCDHMNLYDPFITATAQKTDAEQRLKETSDRLKIRGIAP